MDKYDILSFDVNKDNQITKETFSCSSNSNHKHIDLPSNQKINYNKCELYKETNLEPIVLENKSGRLLKVNVVIKNVNYNKEVSVAVIIFNTHGEIIAFKAFTAFLKEENISVHRDFGTLNKTVLFVVPKIDICDPQEIKISVIADYVHPCS